MNYLFAFSLAILGLAIFLACIETTIYLRLEKRKEINLAICVLSARENFDKRQSLRQSWMQDISKVNGNNEIIVTKFVVGKKYCHLPTSDRIDPGGCEQWRPSVPSESENSLGISIFISVSNSPQNHYSAVTSLYLKVLEEVNLQRLGVIEFLPSIAHSENVNLAVVLYDAVSEEELVRVSFNQGQTGKTVHGFNYRSVPVVTLPQGYEFILELEIDHSNGDWKNDGYLDGIDRKFQNEWLAKVTKDRIIDFLEASHGNIFKIDYLRPDGSRIDECLGDNLCLPLVSIIFSVSNLEHLHAFVDEKSKRLKIWEEEMNTVNSKLEKELENTEDILLADVVDIYRNLPDKLLQCHVSLNSVYNNKFVMKTDDDCYVNISSVLERTLGRKQDGLWWWGNFRRSWKVERFGKWQETRYHGPTYPPFACGSGNVISGDLHRWLANNAEVLRRFQGEDVSMGIWFASLNVSIVNDDRWRCGRSLDYSSLSVPDLLPQEIEVLARHGAQ